MTADDMLEKEAGKENAVKTVGFTTETRDLPSVLILMCKALNLYCTDLCQLTADSHSKGESSSTSCVVVAPLTSQAISFVTWLMTRAIRLSD